MRRFLAWNGLFVLIVAVGCGGGGGPAEPASVGSGGGSTSLAAGFAPDPSNPGGNNTIDMAEASRSANLVTVQLRISGANGVYGASADVIHDTSFADFVNWSPGQLLETGNQNVEYQISASQLGRVVIGASRTGAVAGANPTGATPLINLTFRMKRAGASDLRVVNGSLLDAQSPPQAIPGLSWYAGTLVAN